MPRLRAIFFDIDDTLYSTTEFAEKARRDAIAAMQKLGLKGDPEELYRELLEVVEEFSPNFGFHFDKLLDRIPKDWWKGLNRSLLIAAAVMAYHTRKAKELHLYPDAQEFLEWLRPLPLIKGVITSGLAIKQAEKILRLGLLPYLTNHQAVFISDEVGINKPNPKLFQRALSTFSLLPEETLYVGDHPERDVLPCRKLGIWTVWLKRGKHATKSFSLPPHFTISHFQELKEILQSSFELK